MLDLHSLKLMSMLPNLLVVHLLPKLMPLKLMHHNKPKPPNKKLLNKLNKHLQHKSKLLKVNLQLKQLLLACLEMKEENLCPE
jgi:hypothetical protein